MEVQLYVYDLTRGMARTMSQQLLGIQIDAVYHTALVFGGVEYFFGQGVQTCYPGTTHHGRPMEVINMGTTQLDPDTIMEYLEGLKQVYTAESYDLFAHNCNNFTNDFGMFLVGKGIPAHITNLPKRVLDTPFGQMLRPQIDAGMRSVTQASVPAQNVPVPNKPAKQSNTNVRAPTNGTVNGTTSKVYGSVVEITDLQSWEKQLSGAAHSCATIFFTSSTCAPCKLAYPTFDRLAEQYPQALFVKTDINRAHDVAARYGIRATPTFMTFSRGAKVDEWTGADPSLLKTNAERVLQQTFPPHPHALVNAPTLQFGSMKPVVFAKVPPLEKLTAKLGAAAKDSDLAGLKTFVAKRQIDPHEATIPDLQHFSSKGVPTILALPLEVRFAAVDLLRCAMVDPRVSGFFAAETDQHTLSSLIAHVGELGNACPHNLRLVTLHLASNCFTSEVFVKHLENGKSTLTTGLVQLIASSLLDAAHPTTRVAAASLAFNLATNNYRARREDQREAMSDGEQVELAASLLETLAGGEESEEAVKALLLAFGYLVFFAPGDGELIDLCGALEAKETLGRCMKHEKLAREVASLL